MSMKRRDETGASRPLGRSRLAPSPTGAQHVGNARTFLIAWLDARCDGLEVVLRIEDLDTPRTKAWANDQILEDLIWLGLDWDVQVPNASQRENRYREILDLLRRQEQIYPCTCSRSEIEQSASAPHENSLDGVVYPGTCRERTSVDAQQLDEQGARYAWRFRFASGPRAWCDALYGEQSLEPARQLGDFVVARNYGPSAYQLAVVVDDHDQGITRVVRGSDLIFSTYRQLDLYRALGWDPPQMLHVPLVVGPDGKRLAKRHGDTRLSTLREQKVAPEKLVGYLAWSLGWLERPRPISPKELLSKLGDNPDWRSRLPRSPWVFRECDLFSS
ncbi:MAG: tRNA glutamyl-Q(34) synthetase GluQRS [Pirellula sp.]|jgi:glutamyl-tRNA synthetase|nr:tRNA glutamyl-Q(34) synthetase GluQRS [Pirellula sp.]